LNFDIGKAPGIYEIKNKLNEHRYIGSSCNVRNRIKKHIGLLKNNKHHSTYLQGAWNKHGECNFEFNILFLTDVPMLIYFEQRAIDSLSPEYNIATCARASQKGLHPSPKTREKLRLACAGRKPFLGHKRTEEWKRNNSLRMLGNKHTLGYVPTKETREKARLRMLGNKIALGKGRPHSEEHKRKIIEGRKKYFGRMAAIKILFFTNIILNINMEEA